MCGVLPGKKNALIVLLFGYCIYLFMIFEFVELTSELRARHSLTIIFGFSVMPSYA